MLKNKGYHLEHNFAHSKQALSSVLVALNLIAFSLHAACDACESDWQNATEKCSSRQNENCCPMTMLLDEKQIFWEKFWIAEFAKFVNQQFLETLPSSVAKLSR